MFTKRITLLGIAFALLFSCKDGQKDLIEIIETNFSEEVPQGFTFEFTFNKNIVSDTALNNWIDEPIFNFDPVIDGKYYWKYPNVLAFSPTSYLNPATEYTAKLLDASFQTQEEIKKHEFIFHTPWLKLERAENYWDTRNGNGNAELHGIVHFNYEVDVEMLKNKMSVLFDGKKQKLEFISSGQSKSISYVMPSVGLEDKDREGLIEIDKSLSPAVGGSAFSENQEMGISVDSPFKLVITDILANHDGVHGNISIATSQNVNTSDIKSYIEVTPSITYEVVSGNNSFSIRSTAFDINNKYTIHIKSGLKGLLGGVLKMDEQRDILFGELEPSIKFHDRKNLYLSAQGNRNIEMSIINVNEIKMEIFKVYENNLLDYLRGGGYYPSTYYDERYRGDQTHIGQKGDLVYDETIKTTALPIKGNRRLLNFKFKDKIKNYDGLYLLKISSTENRWLNASKMVALSDLGLIVKQGKESVSVFVNSIKTAKAISGVELTVIGKNNQKVTSQKTDANGVAVIPLSEKEIYGFTPELITARYKEDYNFIKYSRTQIDQSRFDIGGMRWNESGWMAYIYQERDLYRPSEKAHLSAIVRDFKWNTPEPVPVIIKVYSPDGKEYKTIKKTLDKEGALESSIDFPVDALTGTYSLNLLTSNEVHLQSAYIKVEEFVPDRIKVKTNLNKEEYQPGDSIQLDVIAENMFGPPASNRNYEVQMNLSRSYFSSPDYPDYNFSLSNHNTGFDYKLEKGKTDNEGKGSAVFEIPEIYDNMGKLHASLNTTVFDETGRPVNRVNQSTVFTQDVFFGIKTGSYYRKVNHENSVFIVGVDKEGKLKKGSKAEVQLIRHEYRTVLSKSGRYFRYRSQHEEKILDTKEIVINSSQSEYKFTPEISGRYEVRVSIPGSSIYCSRSFYCYGYGRTTNNSFRVNNEGKIDIITDKDQYYIGEKAKILMKTPFSGKVLVTVESGDVIKHFYQETDKKALSFDLELNQSHLPNVYITATLFRAHEESELPLTVAHGFVPIKVDDKKRDIPLSISAVEKSRSKTKQKIEVTGAPNSQVTVAVVDEGILQISGFQTPNPYKYFYQKRALEVSSYNIYPFLFPEVTFSNGKPGGGAGIMKKRVNPMTNKRFELVSFWSGIIKTDENGKAEFEIDIPQFSGELRIMAVDYRGNKFGSAEKSMKVADPIVISPGIPRFLSPRDTVDAIFTVTNTTDQNSQLQGTLTLDGPLKLVGETNQNLSIAPNSEQRLKFRIACDPEIGTGSISLKVDALGESFSNKTNISIRPASPLQKRSGSGVVSANKNEDINLETVNFMKQSASRKLILGTSPMIEFRKDLDYLVRYPHGCLEQTVSKAFPQVYLDDILKETMGSDYKESQARRNVQAAIEKLKTMQLYHGGFTYWPGMGNENWWASAYAIHFLVEAKKAGFQVDDQFLNPALDYLNTRLKSKEKVDYWYNDNLNRRIAPKSVAYSLYVLAMAGQPNKSSMNYYKAHRQDLALDSHYLLAAAYRIIGDERSYTEILPGTFVGEIANSVFGGSFHSYVRDEAISLNALLEADPENQQIPNMARHIAEQLKNRRYLNTQERSFSLLALGKISKSVANTNIQGEVICDGKTVANFEGKTMTLNDKDLKSDFVKIKTSGNGNLYYFWETEGIDKKGEYREIDNFLAVRKSFYDRDGNRINKNELKQNDLVVVRISIRALQNNWVDNVAITDILPAGLEIENPRLKDVPGVNWIQDRSYPDYMDIRDDRISYFTSVSGQNRNFYYMARAVSPGIFQMGPVGADAMYNGEYHSYSGGGMLQINE